MGKLVTAIAAAVAAVMAAVLIASRGVAGGYLPPPDDRGLAAAALHGVRTAPALRSTQGCWLASVLPGPLALGPLARCEDLVPPERALAAVRAAHMPPHRDRARRRQPPALLSTGALRGDEHHAAA
jgi:hypothetical protein